MQLEILKTNCSLCPHSCELEIGEQGRCLIRRGVMNEIGSEAIDFEISTISLEPLSKKPILHFGDPESPTLSLGGYGCSMSCDYCQNWKVSQRKPDKIKTLINSEIITMAKDHGVNTICFTFNEPTLYYSQILGLYDDVKSAGLDFVLKTNAYLNDKCWRKICDHVDAMNIDFKGSEERHAQMIGTKEGTCNVILDNILYAINSSNAHVEISVPIFEDYSHKDIEPLVGILKSANKKVPIHLLRVFPVNRLNGKPTPKDTLDEYKGILSELSNHIHIHNIYGK